jgi:HAD superfamily hydrolase (TIGR01549 family)
MKGMKLKAVLFDFDGTVIDLNFKYAESRIVIINFLKELGFDTSGISLYDTTQTVIEKVEKQIIEKSMNMKLSEIKDRIWSIIDEFEVDAVNASELVKETESILKLLSEKGINKGLVTNSGRKAVQLALIRHGLERGFDAVVTRDEVDRLKPYGEGIELALRILSVPIENAVYVGDSANDVLAARSANVSSIIINRKASYIEKLRKLSPKYIVNSLSEGMDLLKQLVYGT